MDLTPRKRFQRTADNETLRSAFTSRNSRSARSASPAAASAAPPSPSASIQGLADHGLLGHFDYLSTVSGGGYIGGWLTAWIHAAAAWKTSSPTCAATPSRPIPVNPTPSTICASTTTTSLPRWLLLADTWTLAATVGRNILLNWRS